MPCVCTHVYTHVSTHTELVEQVGEERHMGLGVGLVEILHLNEDCRYNN